MDVERRFVTIVYIFSDSTNVKRKKKFVKYENGNYYAMVLGEWLLLTNESGKLTLTLKISNRL